MNIIVSGMPGTGTTTLCKKLAAHMDYSYVYAGNIFRDMAEKEGVSIETFHANLANDPEKEKAADEYVEAILKYSNNCIVEARMSPFMACGEKHHSILLTATETERVHRQMRRPEYKGLSFKEVKSITRERIATERERYMDLYGIQDHFDESCFNIIVETTCLEPDEVLERILKLMEMYEYLPPSHTSLFDL